MAVSASSRSCPWDTARESWRGRGSIGGGAEDRQIQATQQRHPEWPRHRGPTTGLRCALSHAAATASGECRRGKRRLSCRNRKKEIIGRTYCGTAIGPGSYRRGRVPSGGSRNQNLWGRSIGAMGPNHICYSKIALDSSKPVGPDGPTGYTYVRHCACPLLIKLCVAVIARHMRPCAGERSRARRAKERAIVSHVG
jgi:hypothetical protein